MGNSIAVARRRPRVRSVNFRSVWWLVLREAAWRVLCEPHRSHPWVVGRAQFMRLRGDHLQNAVGRVIRQEPRRRWAA